ncbi:helix-turn-helix transcriptional regulator [Pseudoxanthomonas wuyuanensis]|uniref:helix-turn-helix transcriptional regulator n=1 Tax=Pseudoxanthomonas wuyuanensis TaxID=1073196 RepID=UPI0013899911|nr:AraC family transcriptional regulator [Pseudoxanthomonas wuyuanensis]
MRKRSQRHRSVVTCAVGSKRPMPCPIREHIVPEAASSSSPVQAAAAAPCAAEPHTRIASHGLSARALERTLAYIHEHLCESFTLADLARAACISRFHFARMFRVSVGSSPMEYVLKTRMEAAKRMLVRGDQKIAATAAALGFFDQSHFTRTFRRFTGVSPRAFSRLHPHSGSEDPACRFGRASFHR